MSSLADSNGEAIPYRGDQPFGKPDDLVILDVLNLDCDERLWVPQSENIMFRPLLFSVSQGYYVNILRVSRSGVLSRHRHSGPVHALTLKGRWHYLEHDWWAEEGGYSYEPPGDVHTLHVPDDVDEMVVLFHVTGGYVYVDPEGAPNGVEDVFSKLKIARQHYDSNGVGTEYLSSLIR